MDNSTRRPPDRAPTARFVPDRRFTGLAAAGALVALGVTLGTDDRDGRLLALIAVVMLAFYVVGDLVYSPRIEANANGVRIRSAFTRANLRWDEIDTVRVVSRRRGGLRTSALEIDAGAVIAEFSRRSLGLAPEEALTLLLAFRPAC